MCLVDFDVKPYRVENIVHTYEFDPFVHVDVKKAWEMPGEELRLPMKDVEHVLEEVSWEGRVPVISGVEEPHWSLILEADLDCPIVVTREPMRERLTIVDGRHRVVKAWILGDSHVAAKLVDYEELLEHATIPYEDFMETLRVSEELGAL